MKKYFVFIFVIFVFCLCVKAASEDKFVNALKNCSPYNESGSVNVNGVDTQSVKEMSGWQGGKCVYKEILNYGGTRISTVCRFTKPQIDEIVSVADAYYTTLRYSNEKPDLSSVDAIQNNPVAQVIGKYLQDSSVCNIEGLQ